MIKTGNSLLRTFVTKESIGLCGRIWSEYLSDIGCVSGLLVITS
jgi:hypothetical protein